MRKVCVVVCSRANYASIKSVMRGIDAHPDLELQTVAGASALLDRYGSVVDLVESDGLHPSAKGKRVKLANGKFAVTDGPFTESKELVASYALFQVKSMDEAIHWTRRFLEVLGKGECELRPIFEPEDFSEEVFTPQERAREAATRQRMQSNAAKNARK